jgi:hypothetical protein
MMKAKVLTPFNTATQRFPEGAKVTINEVGETLFYACTDAEKPKEPAKEPEVPKKPKGD